MTWYVVDGMDGSGKSTVADMIRAGLEARGRSVLVMTHPNRDTFTGRLELAFLRRDGKINVIVSTTLYILDVLHSLRVKRGRRGRAYDDVIFVRYSMAVAYLPDRLCGRAYDAVERILPVPDVAVLVDLEPQMALGRIMSRGEDLEVFETVEKLGAIRERMLRLSEGWIVLDNGHGLEHLGEQVDSLVIGGPT